MRSDQFQQRHRPPSRRDRVLSRSEIVRAAIALADAEGPDAISMRRIARELRAGAMSLYWYVGSKEELLDLMLDQLEGEIAIPDPTGDWLADLRTFAQTHRAVLKRHLWAVDIIGTKPPSGPNDIRNLERMLALFDGLDLDPALMVRILMTVGTFVIGAVIRESQEIRGQREQEQAQAQMSPQEIEAEQQLYHDWFHASGKYPHVERMLDADVDPDDPKTRDERFEFGLDCLLAGIGAKVGKALPAPAATSGSGRRAGRSSWSPSPGGGRAAGCPCARETGSRAS
jgi:AcrR family transcriptional regulator